MIAFLAVPALLPAQEYPDVSRGKAVYERHCQTCHGAGRPRRRPGGWADLKVAPADFQRYQIVL